MFDEKQIQRLCTKYNIKYKLFETTGTVLIDTGWEEWQIKYVGNRDRPYCLMHKNKLRQTSKFHVQRYLVKLSHALDSIINHKNIIVNMGGSSLHKSRHNTKINTRRKHY